MPTSVALKKKKGGIKVHTVIHANEGAPSDIKFTSAATNDSFMLKPNTLNKGDIMAMDRAYIDYGKFEELTQRGVIHVTKMKKNQCCPKQKSPSSQFRISKGLALC